MDAPPRNMFVTTTTLLLLIALAAEPEFEGPPLVLEALIEEVARAAPQLRAEDEGVNVATARIGVEGAWQDPIASVMVEDVPFRSAEDAPMPMPMLTWRLSQELNVFGRRGLAKDAARAQAATQRARRDRVQWDITALAVGAFYELWMNRQMRSLLDRQIAILERMRDSAKGRYAAGLMMAHHDVLRSEAELSSMRAMKRGLRGAEQAMIVLLNTLRRREVDAPIGGLVLPERQPLPDVAALEQARGGRPELEAMRQMSAEMQARRALAGRMYLPMPMVGAFYQQRNGMGPDSFGGEVALTVPLWWWDRQANEVEMANAMVRRAQRDLEAMDAMTVADVRMAWARAFAEQQALQALEESALPRFKETVASAEAAYVAGRGNYLELLEAVMTYQRVEAQRYENIVRRELALFELSRLLGRNATGQNP